MATKKVKSKEETEIAINPFQEIANKSAEVCAKRIADVRSALASKNSEKFQKAMAELSACVKKHNKDRANVTYDRLVKEPNPIISAVKEFTYETVKVETKTNEDGVVNAVNLSKSKATINLKNLCAFGKLNSEWIDDCGRLLTKFSLRKIDVYSMTDSDLVTKSQMFIEEARKKQRGETPDSNTQIVKLLQEIIDKAIFVDDGNGKNAYKCTNVDIAFINDASTKLNTKEKCTIDICNEKTFNLVIMNVFAHCLGAAYAVKRKQKSKEELDAKETSESK